MIEPIRVMIVDDEPLACENIRLLLAGHDGLEVIGECESGAEAIAAVTRMRPDLLFLDIELGDMNGFDVLERLESPPPPVVIFITAYDEYAIRAFEVSAVDYLLKPCDDERFRTAVDRAVARIRENRLGEYSDRLLALLQALGRGGTGQGEGAGAEEAAGRTPGADGTGASQRSWPEKLAVRSTGRVEFVPCVEIDWIGAAGSYVELHTPTRTYLMRETMTALAERLDPACFARIHRSAIVNISRIRELKPHRRGEYHVILRDGTGLKLSRTYRDRLDTLLGQ